MTTPAEPKRIEANLAVIRAYLKRKFPHHVLTEVDAPGLYQQFSMTNTELDTHYKLKVVWFTLADHGQTPETILSALERDNVAGKMMQATDYFVW